MNKTIEDYKNEIDLLRTYNKVLIEKLLQLKSAQPKWISVEERLPEVENENGTLQCTETVLAVDKNGYFYTGFFRIYKYDKSIEFVGCDHVSLDVEEFDVTHWMPLPNSPKEGT